jgi:sulfotransferase
MTKTFHFISGLPRSGSTLLCNILCQNPKFHATSTSGVIDLVMGIRNTWDKIEEFKANPNNPARKRVMGGIFETFYADIGKKVVFDKSRGWLSFIETLEHILGREVKILVPVRDIRDVISSFEKIWRRDSKDRRIPQEESNFLQFQTIEGRTNVWLSESQPLGISYNRIKDAKKRGFEKRMHLIDFDDLTANPEEALMKAYDFLEEPYFKHDFNEVKQITKEDDSVYGFNDLHTIRTKVAPMKPQWPSILGKDFEHLSSMNFWKP